MHRKVLEGVTGGCLSFAPANLQKCVGGFLLSHVEDFAWDFPGGFFCALFRTKMRKINPATKSAKTSGGSKAKIREKIRSAKNRQ